MHTNASFRGRRASYSYAPTSSTGSYPIGSLISYIENDLSDNDIRSLAPVIPVAILLPDEVENVTRAFIDAFTGHVMYATKCNPDPVFLKAIYDAGVRHFDVASISEVRLVRSLFPDATLYFMHPIKAPEAMIEAYGQHGVRTFVLDYDGELDKIINVLGDKPDLVLYVRFAIPKDKPGGNVATDFVRKFGISFDKGVALLRACRPHCAKLGVSFHVGTQCEDPHVYEKAVAHAARAITECGVTIDALDVGGGFPAQLNVTNPLPPMIAFTQAIASAIKYHNLGHLELICEVGRAIVASGGSLITRVEGRKDDLLYLNDGTYGGMFEAGGSIGLPYPVHLIRFDINRKNKPLTPFRFAGPTCDSVDWLNGPFMLPDDIQVGDWIRVEQLGAYGEVSRTSFNGFDAVHKIIVGPKE
jgi:ornithine decarboxylase